MDTLPIRNFGNQPMASEQKYDENRKVQNFAWRGATGNRVKNRDDEASA